MFVTINTETINLAHVKRFKRVDNHVLILFADDVDLIDCEFTSQIAAEQMEAKILDGLTEKHLMI